MKVLTVVVITVYPKQKACKEDKVHHYDEALFILKFKLLEDVGDDIASNEITNRKPK